MLKRALEYLGRDPQKSVKLFTLGLGLFAIGLAFIGLGYFYHHLWQLPGLAFLGAGCLISAWGYIGIFANRLLTMTNRF
jgi:hypothetical protein